MTHSCVNKIWNYLMIFFSNGNIRNDNISEDNAKNIKN